MPSLQLVISHPSFTVKTLLLTGATDATSHAIDVINPTCAKGESEVQRRGANNKLMSIARDVSSGN